MPPYEVAKQLEVEILNELLLLKQICVGRAPKKSLSNLLVRSTSRLVKQLADVMQQAGEDQGAVFALVHRQLLFGGWRRTGLCSTGCFMPLLAAIPFSPGPGWRE